MNSSEFKKILKPLIKQTIKEVILEEGILSGIVSEVVKGMASNTILESKVDTDAQKKEIEEYERERQIRIQRLNETTNMKANIFEGTTQMADEPSSGALSGVLPSDSGVDISGILDIAKDKWKRLI